MGAQVEGVGTRQVHIKGVRELAGAEHTIMYDRLDAGLLMMASAITGGDIALKGVVRDHLYVFEAKLQQMGIEMAEEGAWMRVRGPETLSPINVVTTFYPGFPTDLQPGVTASSVHGQRRQLYPRNRIRRSPRSRQNLALLRRSHCAGKGPLGVGARASSTQREPRSRPWTFAPGPPACSPV